MAPSLLYSLCRVALIASRGARVAMNSLKTVLACTSSILALAACSPEMKPVSSEKPAASSSNTPSPSIGSPNPNPTTGNPGTAKAYTRGQVYGSCLRSLDSNFKSGWAETSPSAPVEDCTASGTPKCASGFQLVLESVVQMNCSATPSLTNTSMCYYTSQKCVKLAGLDADENYRVGQTYGVCLRQFDTNFKTTWADTAAPFPITSCPMSGESTCAAGFKLVSDPPVQMNCSPTPNSTFVPCYYRADRCIKI